jgi:hypothetical protein
MMVKEATIQHLHEMRLSGMADTYRTQNSDSSLKELPFDERFGMMADGGNAYHRSEHQKQQHKFLKKRKTGSMRSAAFH